MNGLYTVSILSLIHIFWISVNDEDDKAVLRVKDNGIGCLLYTSSCYIKNIDFEGDFFVGLNSKHNSDKTKIDISSYKSNWNKIEAVLISNATEDGGLTFEFNGKGTILIDFVSLVPQSSYGYGMGNWKYTSLRNDLYTALSELSPKFIRFSTDFSSSENNTGKLHSWKNTIGKTEERVQTLSLIHI